MRYAIISNETEQSIEIRDYLTAALTAPQFTYDTKTPELVLTVGGDGTLLSAFHQYEQQLDTVRFVSLHTGHLGFYTDWQPDEVDELIALLKRDNGVAVKAPVLQVTVQTESGESYQRLALNEATVRRMEGTLTADVSIRGVHFEQFRGDGLCVSTPSGSTGHNKSLGGALLHPSLDTLQLTEMAAINNRVFRSISSPLVIGAQEWITFDLARIAPQQGVYMTIDQFHFPLPDVATVRFEIAPVRARFARYRHMHFWDRVKQSFISEE